MPGQIQIPRIVRYAGFHQRICTSAGKEQKQAKAEYEKEFGEKWKKKWEEEPSPPALLHPRIGVSTGYRLEGIGATETEPAHSHFDADLLVLVRDAGPGLPLVSTLSVILALRKTVLKRSGAQPTPAWVCGHEPNGQPLRSDDDVHLAFIPLPFVDHEYADGHLLGLGLVLPRSVDRTERGRAMGSVFLDESGQSRIIDLTLGRLGVWRVRLRDWTDTQWALKPETWTASPNGADTRASVTPIVLDKFPKSGRLKNHIEWRNKVAEIIVAACRRIGLPKPAIVDIDTTSWLLGSPRATAKRRPLRGCARAPSGCTESAGDGFPPFPRRGTNAPRPHPPAAADRRRVHECAHTTREEMARQSKCSAR